MKKASLCISFFVLSVWATSPFAATAKMWRVKPDAELPVGATLRDVPATESEIVGIVKKGEVFRVLEQNEWGWLLVESADGERGWVFRQFVEESDAPLSENPDQGSVSPTDGPEPAPAGSTTSAPTPAPPPPDGLDEPPQIESAAEGPPESMEGDPAEEAGDAAEDDAGAEAEAEAPADEEAGDGAAEDAAAEDAGDDDGEAPEDRR